MKIKKGDKVIVIAGADKGKVGTVQKAFPAVNKVIVDGVNVRKKHQKPTQGNPEGSIVEIYAPIHVSNVAIYDEKNKCATRVGYSVEGDKKVRVMRSKKSSLANID